MNDNNDKWSLFELASNFKGDLTLDMVKNKLPADSLERVTTVTNNYAVGEEDLRMQSGFTDIILRRELLLESGEASINPGVALPYDSNQPITDEDINIKEQMINNIKENYNNNPDLKDSVDKSFEYMPTIKNLELDTKLSILDNDSLSKISETIEDDTLEVATHKEQVQVIEAAIENEEEEEIQR